MKRKVVQIAAGSGGVIYAVADDGTTWVMDEGRWLQMYDLPEAPPELDGSAVQSRCEGCGGKLVTPRMCGDCEVTYGTWEHTKRETMSPERIARVEGEAEKVAAEMPVKTRWAVICSEHGRVYLTREQYDWQMHHPDDLWRCPKCAEPAEWDDETYEASEEAP